MKNKIDTVEKLEEFYYTHGENEVNSLLITNLKVYSLSFAIQETIKDLESIEFEINKKEQIFLNSSKINGYILWFGLI